MKTDVILIDHQGNGFEDAADAAHEYDDPEAQFPK